MLTHQIIIIGDAKVGKTTLFRKFTIDEYKENSFATKNVVFFVHKSISFCISDSTGLIDGATKDIPTELATVIICCDLTSRALFANLKNHFNTIKSSNINHRVIVLGLKSDENCVVENQELLNFATRCEAICYIASAKNNTVLCLSDNNVNVQVDIPTIFNTIFDAEVKKVLADKSKEGYLKKLKLLENEINNVNSFIEETFKEALTNLLSKPDETVIDAVIELLDNYATVKNTTYNNPEDKKQEMLATFDNFSFAL